MRISMDMRDHSASRRTAASDQKCPVSALVLEAQRLIRVYNPTTEPVAAPLKGFLGNEETSAAGDRLHFLLEELEIRASSLQAKSASGALFQLGVASHWLELISHQGPMDERRAKMLQSILFSLAVFIENRTGSRQEDACGEFYMPQSPPHFSAAETSSEILGWIRSDGGTRKI